MLLSFFVTFLSFFLFVQFILLVPAGSSTEPLLIKAEPVSNAHDASVIKYLGKAVHQRDKQLCRH